MHRRHTAETNDLRDEEQKTRHDERVNDICKTLVDIIEFEHKFAKQHLRSNLNENRVRRTKKEARNAKTCMQHDFD